VLQNLPALARAAFTKHSQKKISASDLGRKWYHEVSHTENFEIEKRQSWY